ncbi:hypothetical protein BH09ACT12_BH09ACT12_15880 [soil metagenome]
MIDDHTLDALLTQARPEIAHDPECDVCARAASQRLERSRRWPRRVVVAGAAGAAVLSLGAGAAATVGLPFFDYAPVEHAQTVSNGDRCYATYQFLGDGQRPNPASLAAARAALVSLDFDALDISDEIKDVNDAYATADWSGPAPRPDFFYPADSLDSVEAQALSRAVYDAVVAEVRAQGLQPRGFSMETEWKCDDHQRSSTGD